MTIFVNGRFLTQPISGVQRYAFELLTGLDRELSRNTVSSKRLRPIDVLVPNRPPVDPSWTNLRICVASGHTGHLWEQTTLYRASRQGILVSLGNSGPLRHDRHVLALHDAHLFLFPEAFDAKYRLWHGWLRPRLALRAAALITVSRYSAGTLAQHLPVPPTAFHIVPNAAEHVLRLPQNPAALKVYGLTPRNYFLSLGNQSPNKNLAALSTAYACASRSLPNLAIAGGLAPGLQKQSLNAQKSIKYLGRVPDDHLRALMENASAFVFPSLNEGFGIPPLEAMQLGVPVLCAQTSAMPEILGDAPLWFDPYRQNDIVDALHAFADQKETQRAIMVRKGRRQAARYNWQSSARLLIDLIADVQNRGRIVPAVA